MEVRSEWRNGWRSLGAATIAQAFAVLQLYSFGMFIEPLQQEFGWSRAFISSGVTLTSVIIVIGAPFLGRAIDTIGARPIALAGVVSYFSAFGALSLMTDDLLNFYALWALLALGGLLVKSTVWVSEIVRLFTVNRGMAVAIVISGTSLGAIALPTLAQIYISTFGWRGAYIALATTGFMFAAPLVFLFFGRRQPNADTTSVTAATVGQHSEHAQDAESVRIQILSRPFIQLAVGGALFTFSVSGISSHLVPIVAEYGIDRSEAGKIAALLGVASLVGRLSTGKMLDSWPARRVAMGVVSVSVVGAFLMGVAPSPTLIWVSVLLIGFSIGAEFDIIAYLIARVLGQRHFGTLFGIVVGLMTLVNGIAPLLAGHLYDTTGSYYLWFLGSAASLSVATLLIGTVPRGRDEPANATAH
jgi:MFS family permease